MKPVIVINSLEFDYFKNIEIQMSIKKFDDEYSESFSKFIEEKICEKEEYGVYEYDGKFGDFEYVIQTDIGENDNMIKIINKIENEINNYFKNKNVEVVKYTKYKPTDPNSFFCFRDILNNYL